MTKTAIPTALLHDQLRKRALSSAQVADMTGVPCRTMHRVLCSRSNPPLIIALLVGELLEAEVDDLFRVNDLHGLEW